MWDPHSEGPLVPQSIVLHSAACSLFTGQEEVCLSNLQCKTCNICPSRSFLGELVHPQLRVSPAGMQTAQEGFPKRKTYPHAASETCGRPPAHAAYLGRPGMVTAHKDFSPSVGRESVNSPLPSPKRGMLQRSTWGCCHQRLLQMNPALGQVQHPERETLCCFLLTEFWLKGTFEVF